MFHCMSLLESVLIVLCDHGLSAVKEFGRYSPCFRTASTPTSKGNSAKKKKKHAQVTEPHIDSIELKSIEMKIELKKTYKVTNDGVYIGVNTINGVNTVMIRY